MPVSSGLDDADRIVGIGTDLHSWSVILNQLH